MQNPQTNPHDRLRQSRHHHKDNDTDIMQNPQTNVTNPHDSENLERFSSAVCSFAVSSAMHVAIRAMAKVCSSCPFSREVILSFNQSMAGELDSSDAAAAVHTPGISDAAAAVHTPGGLSSEEDSAGP